MFQETKLMGRMYTRGSAEYRVIVIPASSRNCGGVALFYWDSPAFAFEVIRQFSANVIACQMSTGERR